MWNNNSDDFGGQAAGGFMDTSGMGISPSQKTRTFKSQSVVSMSIAGIRQGLHVDNSVYIGQEKVDMVSLLGLITSVNVQSTVVNFKVDDMTSDPLDVKQWVEQNGDMSVLMKPLVENCYVHVMGSIRSTNGEIYMVANRVRSMDDLNELTTHLADVIHAKLLLEKGLQPCVGATEATNVMKNTNLGVGGFGNDGINGLTAQQQRVWQCVSKFEDEIGCGVDNLVNLMGGMSRDMIKNTLTFLCEEGHIYTTTDDEHYKAT